MIDKASVLSAFARAGYGARGIVYLTIGALAALTALPGKGGTTDSKGAIQTVELLPAGNFLLVVLAVGLVGYSLWRFVQAVFDADRHGNELQGLAIRGGLLVGGLIHLGLALFAISLVGAGTGSRGSGPNDMTAQLMQMP